MPKTQMEKDMMKTIPETMKQFEGYYDTVDDILNEHYGFDKPKKEPKSDDEESDTDKEKPITT